MVVISNENVATVSLLTLHGNNTKDSDKQDIVSNTQFEEIIPLIKRSFFHQIMIFLNKLKLSDQKYQTNGNVRDENYRGKFLFPMKDFV